MTEVLKKVKVDFAYASDGDLLPTRSLADLVVGASVILYDGEGNLCGGEVVTLDARRAWVRPLWDTWMPSESVPRVWYPAHPVYAVTRVDGDALPQTAADGLVAVPA